MSRYKTAPNPQALKEIDKAVATALGEYSLLNSPEEIGRIVFQAYKGTSSHHLNGELIDNIMDFEFEDNYHSIKIRGDKRGYKDVAGQAGYGYYIWDIREGMPYQSDLEAFVYRRKQPPKPYTSDIYINHELQLKYGISVVRVSADKWAAGVLDGISFDYCQGVTAYLPAPIIDRDPKVAICKAFLNSKKDRK